MKENIFKFENIAPTWNSISKYFVEPSRLGMDHCFNSLHYLSSIIKEEEIEGDIIECGVYKGGNIIWLAKLFEERNIWVADSFEGNQKESLGKFPHPEFAKYNGGPGYFACSLENVKQNFKDSQIELTERIKFLKGWYRDTLYDTNIKLPEKIAILRIDSDGYSSYMEVLTQLYDRVVSGGFIIFDDYSFPSIYRGALAEFFNKKYTVVFKADGNLAVQIGSSYNLIEGTPEYILNLGAYMRKDKNNWKPNMEKYKIIK